MADSDEVTDGREEKSKSSFDDSNSAEPFTAETVVDTQNAIDETVEKRETLDETVEKQERIAKTVEKKLCEAVEVVKEAYYAIARSLGASLSEEALEDDCKAYIKSKIKGVDDSRIECLNGVGRGSDVSVSYKICLVADKRTGGDFALRLTRLVDSIAEVVDKCKV